MVDTYVVSAFRRNYEIEIWFERPTPVDPSG
jgi:hypothetical protein